jgi:hypothetical protein
MSQWHIEFHHYWPPYNMEVGDKLHAPVALRPRKSSPVPTGLEAGWDPVPVWTLWSREISYTAWNITPVVQPVALRFTDWATLENTERVSVLTRFIFIKWVVRISTQTPAILTEILRDFSQSLQKCAVVVPRLDDNHFLPDHSNSLFTSHAAIRRYRV